MSAFADFVASQQDSSVDLEVDRAVLRDEWLSDLDALYLRPAGYLSQYLQARTITHSFTEIPLTEENLGTYSVRRMDIKLGKQSVSLEPVGTLLIGCKGSVDIVGFAGRVQLLLLRAEARGPQDLFKVTVSVAGKNALPQPPASESKPISWAWKIVTNTVPRKFVDLHEDAFLQALMEVLNA